MHSKSRQFFGSLESLRGIAALIVVLRHIRWMNPASDLTFIRNGDLMVDFFFVLSGFVICHSYSQQIENIKDLSRFMWLRLGRLYPLHFVLLLVFCGFEILKYIMTGYGFVFSTPVFTNNNLLSLLSNLFLVQSLNLHEGLSFNGPSWSISTEYFTYLLFAITVLFVKSRTGLTLASLFMVFAGVAALLLHGGTGLSCSFDFGYFRCVSGFFTGVLTYIVFSKGRGTDQLPQREDKPLNDRRQNLKSKFAILLFLIIIGFLSLNKQSLSDFLFLPLAALLIYALAETPDETLGKILKLKPFAWLGKVSYSIYMVHAAVLWMFTNIIKVALKAPAAQISTDGAPFLALTPQVGTIFLFLAVATVLIFSHFTYKWIEDPFRKRSREFALKWFSSKELKSELIHLSN